jgi:HSP20 family molecular chaperone IbpA
VYDNTFSHFQVPSSTEIEALGAANNTLDCHHTAPVLASSLHSTSASSIPSAQDLSPPLFARPEISADALVPCNEQKESITLPAFPSGSSKQQQQQQAQSFPKTVVAASGHWAPQASVVETEFGYLLQAVVPGVNPKEVRAELLPGGRLVITGIRHNTSAYHRNCSGVHPASLSILPDAFGEPGWNSIAFSGDVLESGRFRLVWKLPGDANQESIKADFKVNAHRGFFFFLLLSFLCINSISYFLTNLIAFFPSVCRMGVCWLA